MSIYRTNSLSRRLLELGRDGSGTLHGQLEDSLRTAIRQGLLSAGIRLPPSRMLAEDLDVSRGVVVEAYAQLVAEGYLTARTGAGTWVAANASVLPSADAAEPSSEAPRPRYDFRPGAPDLSAFPRSAWNRALQRSLRQMSPRAMDYPDPCGLPEVRRELTAYLIRSRAALASPRDVILTAGFAQGLALVAQVLRRRGLHRIGVEDPGLTDQRDRLRWHGLEPVPVPVDEEGLRVTDLEHSGVRAVVLTPAHQYPTGYVLSAARRAAVLGWASSREAWIFEDDYDAEYRYDGQPVGCLQGLAPHRVIHAGTASKMLAPALRLGWLLSPPDLFDELAAAKRAADLGTSSPNPSAFADLIGSGELDRHLRRTRAQYRRRRDRLLQAIGEHLPAARAQGIAAGLHVVLQLPWDFDAATLQNEAAARSVAVKPLSHYCVETVAPPALVLGYTRLGTGDFQRGVARLAEAVVAARIAGSP